MPTSRLAAALVALVLGVAATAAPAAGTTTFHENFDGIRWWEDWGRTSAPAGTQRWSSTTDGNVLRVWFRPGDHSGAGWFLPTGAAERVQLRYRIRFGPTWVAASEGKLPGFGRPLLRRGDCVQACGRRPVADGAPYHSARASFGPAGTAGSYVYGPRCTGARRPRTGDTLAWEPVRFVNGRWYDVEQVLTMNTPDRPDGTLVVKVDGATVLRARDLCLRTRPDVPVGNVWMHFFHGGDLPALSLMWVDVDDVTVRW